MQGGNRRIIVVNRSSKRPRNDHDAVTVLEGRSGVRLRAETEEALELELSLSNYYSRELLHRKVSICPDEDFPMDFSWQREGIYLLRMGFPSGIKEERMIIKIDR
ncbi:MAG: hypothetical protein ABEH38_02330 [Flavobacteriales bacterium]